MRPALAKASAIFLAVLAAVLAWLLVAAASLASAGGPNPLYLRVPRPPAPSAPVSALTVTVFFVSVLIVAAVGVALLQRGADRRATLAQVTSLDARREQDQERKAA